jgi:hypothetical protein
MHLEWNKKGIFSLGVPTICSRNWRFKVGLLAPSKLVLVRHGVGYGN